MSNRQAVTARHRTGSVQIDPDVLAGAQQGITCCEGPSRDGVIRLRCAYLKLCASTSSRKRALPHGGHPLRNAALDPTIGQMRVEAAFAAIHAIEGHHHKEHFEDDVIGICAGLWNLVLSY